MSQPSHTELFTLREDGGRTGVLISRLFVFSVASYCVATQLSTSLQQTISPGHGISPSMNTDSSEQTAVLVSNTTV